LVVVVLAVVVVLVIVELMESIQLSQVGRLLSAVAVALVQEVASRLVLSAAQAVDLYKQANQQRAQQAKAIAAVKVVVF
jgi:hypothetical protein